MEKLTIGEVAALNNSIPGNQNVRLGERLKELEESSAPPPAVIPKVIEIGDWDMDTVFTKSIAFGVLRASIRAWKVVIRNDADTILYDLEYSFLGTEVAGRVYISAVNVDMGKFGDGFFDSADFSNTPYNRGWITIWYVP